MSKDQLTLDFNSIAESNSATSADASIKKRSASLTTTSDSIKVKSEVRKTTKKQINSETQVESSKKIEIETEVSSTQSVSSEPRALSVSELNRSIKGILESQYSMVWVQGEISNFKAHSSGHFYFSLKDSSSQINAVMFRGFNQKLKFKPEDGMEVLVRCRVTVYEPRGNYQLFCEMMEPVGLGALQKAFEQLKSKLEAEGLFDSAKKRQLPSFPSKIAIVTSPTGAAIKDMLNVLSRRFKCVEITLIPTSVQGDAAPKEIVAAIELANQIQDFDVMIVGRGGGSIEDLWAFNNESVARAIASSKIPTISAVGHEIDFTIADFVADLRAPTPSAAAELVVNNAADLMEHFEETEKRLVSILQNKFRSLKEKTQHISKRLVDPQRKLQDIAQKCDDLLQRLEYANLKIINNLMMRIDLLKERLGSPESLISEFQQKLLVQESKLKLLQRAHFETKKQKLLQMNSLLDSLSPLRVVDRGYSLVYRNEELIKKAPQVKPGESITICLSEGSIQAEVTEIRKQSIKNKHGQNQKE